MNNKFNSVEKMWKDYLKIIDEKGVSTGLCYESWYFGYNEELANSLADLVLSGEKRATTSLHFLYELEGEELPEIGSLAIITDFNGKAKCIIKNIAVNIVPFSEVTKEYAFTEGEGDKSLKYWREAHIEAFNFRLKEIEKEFTEDMLVVCEEFEVIYK